MKETEGGWQDIVRNMRTGFRELLNKMRVEEKQRGAENVYGEDEKRVRKGEGRVA